MATLMDGIFPPFDTITEQPIDPLQRVSHSFQAFLSEHESIAQHYNGGTLPGNYVLLPMFAAQKQQYKSIPKSMFRSMDLEDAERGEVMLQKLRDTAVHPDLDNDEAYTPYKVEDEEPHEDWDIAVSAKFAFMSLLFQRPGHYGIVAKGFKMRALCKQFISGLGFARVSSTTRVSLLDTEGYVDLIIDLDGTATPAMRKLRHVRLLSSCTVEHFEESLYVEGSTRIATLVAGVFEFRDLAGNFGSVEAAAESVLAYLSGSPLPHVPRLDLDIVHGYRPAAPEKPRVNVPDLMKRTIDAERYANSWEVSFETLMDEHEAQTAELRNMTQQRDTAIQRGDKAVQRSEIHQNKVAKCGEEICELKDKLKKAEAALLDHTVPRRGELEQMRQTSLKATETAGAAENRLKSVKNDLQYVQDMYRDASSRAAALAEENAELTTKLALAERLASETRIKLEQMRIDDATMLIHDENEHNKAIMNGQERQLEYYVKVITDNQEQIRHLEDEVGRLTRGRTTRSSSVPRSPMRSPAAATPVYLRPDRIDDDQARS